MSAAGNISAMIASLKRNKIPKRNNKLGHLEYKKSVKIGKPLLFKNSFSEIEKEAFRQKLVLDKRKKLQATLFIYAFVFITLVIILCFIPIVI